MIPIRQLLNKIKWDPQEKPEEYVLFYLDRISQKLLPLSYTNIQKIEDNFILLIRQGEEVYIPLHHIRRVEKAGKTIWERPV